jgi:VWFA-related protein
VPRSILLAPALAAALMATPSAQRPSVATEDRPIFRLSVSLVQLDAVVTDSSGRHVTTLGPDDFEVFQDGHPQPVVAASYVETGENWHDTSGLPPLPADSLVPAESRRIIAIVVDDMRMSFESVYMARRGLHRFVEDGFRDGDRVVLATTSGPIDRLDLMHSPAVLNAAINRLRYQMWGVRPASALDPVDGNRRDDWQAFQEFNFSTNAVTRLMDIISALKPLPGRKSVVLVSEGFTIFGAGMDNSLIRESLQHLADQANRAGVVIYGLDPRGLVNVGLTAADSGSAASLAGVSSRRASALRDSQDGLRFVADETGGFAVVNQNDLAYGMRRIATDQEGYYLIGYEPEAGTVVSDRQGRFRRVKIKVRGKGLHVRTRSGFYGVATE